MRLTPTAAAMTRSARILVRCFVPGRTRLPRLVGASLSVLLAAATPLMAAPPASAAVPEHFSFAFGPEEDPAFATCDGFNIALSTAGRVSGTVLFDDAGEPYRFIVHTRLRDTLVNSVTGTTVVNRGVFTEIYTRVPGTDDFTSTLQGFKFMGTRPGRGLVLQDVGHIVFSPNEEEILFIAGQHHVPDDGDEALFCAALA